jgi:hypothetical protein
MLLVIERKRKKLEKKFHLLYESLNIEWHFYSKKKNDYLELNEKDT